MGKVIDLAVVGGGAAGLVCAIEGSGLGLKVLVLEKGERCGKKLSLTGGKRCNFTHIETPARMAERFDAPREAVFGLLRLYPYQAIIEFFRRLGIEPQVDAEGCVWPKGCSAAGFRDILVRAVQGAGAEIRTNARVVRLEPGWRVVLESGEVIEARSVLVATGGASYPHTGSTGDGNRLAEALGLKTVQFFPALAALTPAERVEHLAGITQPRVEIKLPEVRPRQGNFIFAHQYISGSAVMNISGFVARRLATQNGVRITVDWVPEVNAERLRQDFSAVRKSRPRIQANTLLSGYVARRLANFICEGCGVAPDTRLGNLSNRALERLIAGLKATGFQIVGTEPLARATVCGGGVALEEVRIPEMAAQRFPGLYFAGEALDIWGESGGYNLHFAWASGLAAARAACLNNHSRF